MCLSDNELGALVVVLVIQFTRLCLVFGTADLRGHLHIDRPSLEKALYRSVLYTIPAAALIKLAHDWIGFGSRTVCMSRLAFLLGCFLLCAALEYGSFFWQQAEAASDLELHYRYSVRLWCLYALFGAAWFALMTWLVPFR